MINIKKSISLNELKKIIIFLFWNFSFLQAFFNTTVGEIFGSKTTYFFAILVLYFPVIIFLFISKEKNYFVDSLIIFVFVLLSFLIAFLFNDKLGEIYFDNQNGFFAQVFTLYSGVFGYFFTRIISDYKDFFNIMYWVAWFQYILYFWQPIEVIKNGYWSLNINGVMTHSMYNMNFGYSILFPSLIFLAYGFYNKLKLPILLGSIGMIEMILWGSRGGIICLFLFAFFYVFYIVDSSKKILYRIGFVIVTILTILFAFSLRYIDFRFIYYRLLEYGFESRTLKILFSAQMTTLSGRDVIWKNAINEILLSPILGHGPMYDQSLWGRGTYCHNIILELALTYGIFLAAIIIIMITILVLKFLKNCKSVEGKIMFIILFSSSIGRLMVSSSFWYSTQFWAMLALIIGFQFDKRRKRGGC